jgi:hypothetical protein
MARRRQESAGGAQQAHEGGRGGLAPAFPPQSLLIPVGLNGLVFDDGARVLEAFTRPAQIKFHHRVVLMRC